MSVEVTDSLQSPSAMAPPHPEGSQFLSELLVELDGLVEGVFKLLLRLAVGGPVAVLHGGLAVFMAWAASFSACWSSGLRSEESRNPTCRPWCRIGHHWYRNQIGHRICRTTGHQTIRHRTRSRIACGCAGITTEHLIQGLIQRIRKSYLITERDQRLLEQRE